MISGEVILDAYVDANILIIVGFAIWSLIRVVLSRVGLRHAYDTQLKLLNSVFLLIVISPFVLMAYSVLQNMDISKDTNLNLSDMVVSHFLNGGFEMRATEFEHLLSLRDTFTSNVLNGAGWVARTAIVAFFMGLLIGAFRLVVSVFCLHRIMRGSYGYRNFGGIRIRISDRTVVPFSTRGLRGYIVVIPSHLLGKGDELKVSLAHEFQHLRQGDIEWEILLEILKPFLFLNPAFHAWKRWVEDLRELSCDQAILTRGQIGVRTYCDTLLSVCQKTLCNDPVFQVAVPKVTLLNAERMVYRNGKASFLEHRINSLLDVTNRRYPRLIYSIINLPLIAAVMLTAIAIQRPGDWSQDRLMLSTVVNLERFEERNRISISWQMLN